MSVKIINLIKNDQTVHKFRSKFMKIHYHSNHKINSNHFKMYHYHLNITKLINYQMILVIKK